MASDGGRARIKRRLARIPVLVREASKEATLKQANAIARTMRQLAQSSRDSGDLIDSITVTPGGQQTPPYSQPGGSMTVPENAATVTVGNEDVRYPHLVEYGTEKAPAQPFFWPAVRMHRKPAQRALNSAIRKAARKQWGKP